MKQNQKADSPPPKKSGRVGLWDGEKERGPCLSESFGSWGGKAVQKKLGARDPEEQKKSNPHVSKEGESPVTGGGKKGRGFGKPTIGKNFSLGGE